MQDHSFDVELQRMLNELCADLFATSALDDCNAILQSLALLAEAFLQAQTLLGRLLSQNEDSHTRPRHAIVSKLSALSTNFLYQNKTARSTVALLAALANGNLRNQRRIAQSVTGVKLDIDPTKFGHAGGSMPAASTALFALTVPTTVTSTYRRWKKRQRELQNCRLPRGVPPAHDGVPMPCCCDDCLGAEQFLSTWQQHFHDLSRWARDPDKEPSGCSSSSSLSTEEFFRVFLEDHQVLACTVGEALGNQEPESSDFNRAHRNSGLLYYFVSPEELTALTPRASVQFNPLFHVSAIAIAPEIDTGGVKRAHFKAAQQGGDPSSESLEPAALAAEEVILFTCTADVASCTGPSTEIPDSDAVAPSFQDSNEDLRADFSKLEEQHGQLVQCDSLASDVCSDESEVTAITRHVLLSMISFCEREDHIPLSVFRHNFCPPVDTGKDHEEMTPPRPVESIETAAPNLNTRVVMTANLTEQLLRIDCSPTAAVNTLDGLFSARILQRELTGPRNTGEIANLGLLCLSDEALESLIQRCRVCTCGRSDAHEDFESVIFLQPSGPGGEKYGFSPDTNNEVDEGLAPGSIMQKRAAVRVPLSGLSPEAKRDLARLETLVSEENHHKLTHETLTAFMEKLSRVVADCNQRISSLSIARDKELIRAATEVHRAAAISRCRHCRDLLIQLGKKIALQVRPLDISAAISQGKLLRLAKIVRTSVHDVLVRSDTFDPWETPDARVEKLHLDHRLWASGFPDAAYYQDANVRQRENKTKQQNLSRKLFLQQKKKSNETPRAKQDQQFTQ
ncbi:hypothetical protein KRP22_014092 [Phytophthora ramorum]|nr:hypothetical protein KRP22_9308 [Phytophthora ramorum]